MKPPRAVLEKRICDDAPAARHQGLHGANNTRKSLSAWTNRVRSVRPFQKRPAAWVRVMSPLPVRTDGRSSRFRADPKTAVTRGAGPTAVLNPSYGAYARMCGLGVDACRAGKGSDKGKVERAVRTLRGSFGEVLRRGAGSLGELGRLLDARSEHLLDRLRCPVTGGTVREALEEERQVLQPLPSGAELFDVEVTRQVSRDCLVSFEGRRYSVPFAWVGRLVDVRGTARDVVVRGGGAEIARHRWLAGSKPPA